MIYTQHCPQRNMMSPPQSQINRNNPQHYTTTHQPTVLQPQTPDDPTSRADFGTAFGTSSFESSSSSFVPSKPLPTSTSTTTHTMPSTTLAKVPRFYDTSQSPDIVHYNNVTFVNAAKNPNRSPPPHHQTYPPCCIVGSYFSSQSSQHPDPSEEMCHTRSPSNIFNCSLQQLLYAEPSMQHLLLGGLSLNRLNKSCTPSVSGRPNVLNIFVLLCPRSKLIIMAKISASLESIDLI